MSRTPWYPVRHCILVLEPPKPAGDQHLSQITIMRIKQRRTVIERNHRFIYTQNQIMSIITVHPLPTPDSQVPPPCDPHGWPQIQHTSGRLNHLPPSSPKSNIFGWLVKKLSGILVNCDRSARGLQRRWRQRWWGTEEPGTEKNLYLGVGGGLQSDKAFEVSLWMNYNTGYSDEDVTCHYGATAPSKYQSQISTANSQPDRSSQTLLDSQGQPLFDPRLIKHPSRMDSTRAYSSILQNVAPSGKDPRKGIEEGLKAVQDKLLNLAGPLIQIFILAEDALTNNSIDPRLGREWAQRAFCLLGNANVALSTERRKVVLYKIDAKLAELGSRELGPEANILFFGLAPPSLGTLVNNILTTDNFSLAEAAGLLPSADALLQGCNLTGRDLHRDKDAIEPLTSGPTFLINVFLVKKKSGEFSLVINLRDVNSSVAYCNFKMEGIHLLRGLLCEGVDAFLQQWPMLGAYAFPWFSLIPQTLQKLSSACQNSLDYSSLEGITLMSQPSEGLFHRPLIRMLLFPVFSTLRMLFIFTLVPAPRFFTLKMLFTFEQGRGKFMEFNWRQHRNPQDEPNWPNRRAPGGGPGRRGGHNNGMLRNQNPQHWNQGRRQNEEAGELHNQGAVGRNDQRAAERRGNNRQRGNYNPAGGHNHRAQPQRPFHDRGAGFDEQIRRLGFKALEALLEKEPSEVVITLASHSGLSALLSAAQMKPDLIELFTAVLSKACTSRLDRQSIQHILGQVKDSSYLRTCLPYYVAGMATETIPERRHHYPNHMSNILQIVQELINIFPASTVQETSVVTLLAASIIALRRSGVDTGEQIEQNLERVQIMINHLQDRRREGTLVDTHISLDPDAPAEDYKTISVYPKYEEIHGDEKPFLRPNMLNNKYDSTNLYLDTHFRLLREDFVRPLRDGIQEILYYNEDPSFQKKQFDDIRIYFDTRILAPLCTSSGIVYKVQFDTAPLKMVRWQNSKRLLYGSLVCMSKDNFESFLFATVANREVDHLKQGKVQLLFCDQSREELSKTCPMDSFLMVETTAYFEAYRHVLEGLQEMTDQDVPFQKYIVECQNDLGPPRYLNMGIPYDLTCLKADKKRIVSSLKENVNILEPNDWPIKEDLGFDESQMEAMQMALTKELAIIQGPPGTGKTYVGLKIAQALLTNSNVWQVNDHSYPVLVVCYTNHALDQFLEGIYQFLGKGIVRVGGRSNSEILKQFSLRELRGCRDFRRNFPSHLRMAYANINKNMKLSMQKLDEVSQLLQCSTSGIIHETYLQKHIEGYHWASLHNCLVRNRLFFFTSFKQSVIVEWLGLGVTPLIRTQDPNAEEEVQEHHEEEEAEGPEEEELIEIPEEANLIQNERILDGEEDATKPKRKKSSDDTELAKLLLAISLENKEPELAPKQEGDWEMTNYQKKKRKQKMKTELQKQDVLTEEEAKQVKDVWSLNMNSRWKLYRHWVQLYQQDIRQKILGHEQHYQETADRLIELRLQEDLQILRHAKVIGMTTTGAAKYRRVLQEVEPRIVIVEEAAEVLEAHTITTLSAACQHLILIGDHQQLRPSANVYDLAKNFNLEVSLFERLIKSNLPYVRLNYQHRMRPEIARLLTPHIYQELQNHSSVLNYENIKAVSSNIFFVDHNFPEQEIKDGKSHQNRHEAQFIVELCKYLICQDYKPSQITILTTYTGQLFCLRNLMPAKIFSGVRVNVVDKYQGEENDIILLSLVRSNKQGRVGFLQIANRICVALSRAKKGLYCIGNMTMLGKVTLWSRILLTLKQNGQVGNHLMLCCQNHPDRRTLVSKADDFRKVPEGGCSQKCEFRLNCGHVCTRACHPYDPEHKDFQCIKACQKVLCVDGHRCKRKCFEPCGKCMEMVQKVMPVCSHIQMVPCSVPEKSFSCMVECDRFLQCGHPCGKLCGDDCEELCSKKVTVELKCGHHQNIECWRRRDVEFGMAVKCKVPCGFKLSCDHECPGTCDTCFQGRFHQGCRHPCTRSLICSHVCQEPCTNKCPPCKRMCENRCIHSKCQKKCGTSCVPCMEPCEWRCEHYTCSMLCSEPCDRPPCNDPCPKMLKCRHPCIGLCGEPCPKKCRECHKKDVTEIFFGFEEDEDARFVQLEDCGHIFESSGMDQYMETNSDSNDGTAIKLKVCPKCQTPIRKNQRYGSVINKTLDEIESVKERMKGPLDEIVLTRSRLIDTLGQMVDIRRNFSVEYMDLKKSLQDPDTCLQTLSTLENAMLFYDKLAKLFSNIKNVEDMEKLTLKNRLLQIKTWLGKPRYFFTEQELADLQNEVQRFTYLLELLTRCNVASRSISSEVKKEIKSLREILEGNRRFRKEDKRFVRQKLKELKEIYPCHGLGISENERVMIVKAIGLQTGHWFKCPNNHVYLITECGGAMEESKCPDCKAKIGGQNHMVDPSNALASEMDGAQHAAWSDTANNMLNFEELRDVVDF
ncbi:LOW QUALITY PROTEIN: NFX1-type zinc finger-containing protein 1 [Pelodytes ibericus]